MIVIVCIQPGRTQEFLRLQLHSGRENGAVIIVDVTPNRLPYAAAHKVEREETDDFAPALDHRNARVLARLTDREGEMRHVEGAAVMQACAAELLPFRQEFGSELVGLNDVTADLLSRPRIACSAIGSARLAGREIRCRQRHFPCHAGSPTGCSLSVSSSSGLERLARLREGTGRKANAAPATIEKIAAGAG